MDTNNLYNIVDVPTRKDKILDLFMVNNQDKYKIKDNIVNRLISDHNILSTSTCNKSKLDGDMGERIYIQIRHMNM